MPSIADNLRAKRTPTVYPETVNGMPLREECYDYVLHPFMTSYKCSKCNDRGWVLTPAGQIAYKEYLERRANAKVFKDLLTEES